MKITDKRNDTLELTFDKLVQGNVYVDVYNQKYVMMTDEESVIDLSSGILAYKDEYHNGCVFISVESHLEIR